ncbi:MAG: ABC transporter ATP-binding protein [Candidatus Omnitrophica bacterium]|nr:ABC transporter ATP-binding protein [Candidatus Omnitrophota bacterium]
MAIGEKIRFLWKAIRVYKYFALFLFFIILAAALTETIGIGMVMPFLEVVFDPGSSSGSVRFMEPILSRFPDAHRLMVIGILLMGLILIKNLLIIFRIGLSTHFVFRFRRLWQCAVMEKYMYAEYSFLLSHKQGYLLNNLLIEPGRAAKSLQQLIEFSSKAILAFSLYCLLIIVSWKATLSITFVGLLIVLLLSKPTYNYAIGVGRKKVSLSQDITAMGAENISAIRQIKIFSLENDTCRRFREKLEDIIRVMTKFNVIRRLPNPIAETLFIAGVVLTLLYLNYFTLVPLMTIAPVIGLFVVTSQRFFPVVSQLFAERMNILTFIPSLKVAYGLYDSKIRNEELKTGEAIDSIKRGIEFKNVFFTYKGSRPLFEDLSLIIPKGKTTAIVGPSGSGKSTMVDLLTGFFKKQNGEILINGIDIDRINLRSCRRLIGYVSQDTFLFNATVRENIIAGRPDAPEREMVMAAKQAHADEFIRRLPQGYDTVLGDRGLKVSGGQRQRIAIARVLIRNPEVLIFDEATSSLDSESERLIQESIDSFAGKKTIIVISHRFSTVKNADVIYVFDKGHIVESGTFEELEKSKGRFYQMNIV